jgi:chondroitin 4-sulfotransferase 11
MPVSHELRCIHVHIPRTGGTSIEHALGMFHDWKIENRTALFGLIRSPDLLEAVSVSRFLQHATAREVLALLPPECAGYFSFAFVRNPWDRMVSVFCHQDPHLAMQAAAAGVDLPSLTFGQFLDAARSLAHVHLLPQVQFIHDERGTCLVDFLGRFERLAQDFALIKERLGIDADLACHNRSSHEDYRSYYDNHSRRLVEEMYREDIEAFGYEF